MAVSLGYQPLPYKEMLKGLRGKFLHTIIRAIWDQNTNALMERTNKEQLK